MKLKVKLVYLADFRVLFGNEDPSVTTPVALMCLKKYALEKRGLESAVDISLLTFRSSATMDEMIADISPADADVIGVSCYFWNISRSLKLIRRIRKENPSVKILMGGPESEETVRIMEENPAIDICVRGEGEEVFAEILENLTNETQVSDIRGTTIRIGGEIKDTEGRGILRNMNDLPEIYTETFFKTFPPGEIFYHSERGCKCNCKYCTLGPPLRQKDLSLVEPEVRRIFENPNITYVNFWDSDMTWDINRFKEILRMVDRYNTYGKKVSVNYGFLNMDEEVLQLLGKNVNRIIMGFQSTNPDTTRMAGRTIYDLEERRASLEKAFEYVDPSKINAQFILGLPGDNYETLGESMRWTQRIGFTDVWVVQNLALPGTVYRRDAEKYGLEFKKKPFYNVHCSNTFTRADMKKAKSTLFWFVGLSRIYSSGQLRELAAKNIFIWDIVQKFPYADPKTVEENLEGGDMYDFTLKMGRISHIRRLCLMMLKQRLEKDPAAAEAFSILLPEQNMELSVSS